MSTYSSKVPFKGRGSTAAQAMVEFALALPIFLLLVYGLLEVGRLLFMDAAVITSSREAVRYASAWGLGGGGAQYQYRDCTGIRNAAKNTGFLLGLQDQNINICYDSGPGTDWDNNCKDASGNLVHGKNIKAYCLAGGPSPDTTVTLTSGQRVVVTVSATYSPVLPLFLPLTTNPMSSTAYRTVLGVINLITPVP